MKADRLRHGRPQETMAVMCNCECSKYQHCPITDEDPQKWQDCKAAYKGLLKDKKDGK